MNTIPILPPPIRLGARIGICAPSEPVDPQRFDAALQALDTEGFELVLAPHARGHCGTVSATPEHRAEDLMGLFADDRIDAIICGAGGHDSACLLPLLDYRTIVRSPKVLCGLSDNSALLLGIHRACGLVTFHGPVIQFDLPGHGCRATRRAFARATGDPRPLGRLELWESGGVRVLSAGAATGTLLAGNLTTITGLLGSPYEPCWDDAILVWEDVAETGPSLVSKLDALGHAGVLGRLSGVVIGSLASCEDVSDDLLASALIRHCRPGTPILAGLRCGHTPDKVTLPIGVQASITTAGALAVTEACLR